MSRWCQGALETVKDVIGSDEDLARTAAAGSSRGSKPPLKPSGTPPPNQYCALPEADCVACPIRVELLSIRDVVGLACCRVGVWQRGRNVGSTSLLVVGL